LPVTTLTYDGHKCAPDRWARHFLAVLAGICVGLGMTLTAFPGWAQGANPERNQAESRLKRSQTELRTTRDRVRKIASDVDALMAERKRLNARLLETASNVQQIETRMTTLEGRVAKLAGERDALRQKLSAQNMSIAKLLGAMQRMGRNPPPVIITQRADALKMVRSAMLLARAFPELKGRAELISAQLQALAGIIAKHNTETKRLRAEAVRLNDAKTELAALIETKHQSLIERRKELVELQRTAKLLSQNVTDLRDLIAKLDQAVAQNTRLGSYNARLQAEGGTRGSSTQGGPTTAPAVPPQDGEPGEVVIAPGAGTTARSVARLEPAVPFYEAKAKLPLPASGQTVVRFGDRTQYGGTSKGLVIRTRHAAHITSPSDGWVVYAGEFRSYGQLLIINAGAGYHILLAGLSRIDVQLGQFVLAAEPVGSMPSAPRGGGNNAPVLYVEFRKNGKPIDPSPWWAKGQQRVQG
jgi:murein hydrolase activator